MSNLKFISAINEQISPLLAAFTGARLNRLAQSIVRGRGANIELLPALVDMDGEGTYIGMDDTSPITIYHKANSITMTEKPNSGYGNSKALKINTYANSMIVFLDRKATKMMPDELILLLQANLADEIKLKPYQTIQFRFQNIILNSQQVFASEYQNTEYKIPPQFSLLAINYQIESTFDKSCFATCP